MSTALRVDAPVRDWLLLPGWGFSAQIMMPARDRLFDVLSALPGGPPRVCVSNVPPDVLSHAPVAIDDGAAPRLSLSMARSRLPAGGSPDRTRAYWVECLRREAGQHFGAAADGLAPARPIGLCAWSLGATLALDWAARHPGEIGALVLLGATPRFVAGEGWPCAMPLEEFHAFAGLATSAPRAAQARLAALSAQGETEPATTHRLLRAALRAPAQPAQAGAVATLLQQGLDVLHGTDLRNALGAIIAPVTLFHGAHDALVPVDAARQLAGMLATARLIEVDHGGHASFVPRTAMLVDAIIASSSSSSSSSSSPTSTYDALRHRTPSA